MDISPGLGLKKRVVLSLIADMSMAARLVKTARKCHLGIHNFDRPDALLRFASETPPVLMILDFEKKEAEAFRLMSAVKEDDNLKAVAVVGYTSVSKSDLQREAEKAGCHRVYMKTEFLKNLEDLFVRYGL